MRPLLLLLCFVSSAAAGCAGYAGTDSSSGQIRDYEDESPEESIETPAGIPVHSSSCERSYDNSAPCSCGGGRGGGGCGCGCGGGGYHGHDSSGSRSGSSSSSEEHHYPRHHKKHGGHHGRHSRHHGHHGAGCGCYEFPQSNPPGWGYPEPRCSYGLSPVY